MSQVQEQDLASLMDGEFASGSNAEAELELLALVIESYERSKIQPVTPIRSKRFYFAWTNSS